MADTDLWLSEIDRVLSDIDASAQWSLYGKLAAADLIEAQQRLDRWADARERYNSP